MTTTNKAVTVLGDNGTFSGADMIAHIIFPGGTPITLGQVTTMTYSTYRETHPVRTIGRINVKGFSKGPRTIAGTIIFTVFEKHVVNQIKQQVDYIKNIRKLKPCELPPFDIMITFGNEYGASAKIFIYGIEVVDEGKIFSVEDMFTENTWSYMARDIDLMDDIDAEQNAPLISLGELESAGKFTVDSLVMDDEYVKMQAELDKMKKDKDSAIQAAREQSKEYITSADNWGFEETTIPQTSIPGGEGTADQIPTDPNHTECVEPKLEIYNGFVKPSGAKDGDRIIYFRVDMSDLKLGQHNEAFKNINGQTDSTTKKIKLRWQCDSKAKTWDIGFKTKTFDSPFNQISQSITATLLIKDYYAHKPTPVDLKLSMFGFTLKDKTHIKVQQPYEIKLKTNDGKTEASAVTYKLIREGSNADKKDKEEDGITCDIAFTPVSKLLTESLGRSLKGSYCQYFYRDATSIGYEFEKNEQKRPQLDDKKLPGVSQENDYWTPYRSWLNSARVNSIQKEQLAAHKGSACKHKGYDSSKKEYALYSNFTSTMRAGFNCKITCKNNGKVLSSKEMDKFHLKFDYKVVAMVRGQEVVFDGDKLNNNVVLYKLSDEIISVFRTSKYYKVSDLNANKRKLSMEDANISFIDDNTTQLYTTGIARSVFDAVHRYHDGKISDLTEDTMWYKDTNNCKCRFKYSDMTLVLYDFRICDGSTSSAKELNIGKITGANTAGELRFPISNMDDRVLADFIERKKKQS